MTKRKFYKTVVQVTILSEEPYVFDDSENEMSDAQLSAIATDICSGPCVGDIEVVSHNEEKTGKEMADLLTKLGSEPGFFCLTGEGEDDEVASEEEDGEEG